jgi:ComF family protein
MLMKALLDILFPALCHGCKAFIPDAGELHLCAGCLSDSPVVSSPHCIICGRPFLTEGGIDHRCGGCINELPSFAAARAAVLFEGPVRELIHRFKYGKKVQHSRPLALLAAGELEEFVTASAADLVIPVPLHVKRLRERGFNQAVLLGEILAKKWRLPLSRNNLNRNRWTEPQINLNAAQRRHNVRGAFAVKDATAVRDRRIILLDDVYTTGSTVSECARTLKTEGAAEVFVVTIARALN